MFSGDGGPIKNLSDRLRYPSGLIGKAGCSQYDKTKMVNILLIVALLPKLPPAHAAAAIRAVVLILDDNIEDTSTALSSAIADKFLARIGSVPD